MPKIVVNNCYGGFCLSDAAVELYNNLRKSKGFIPQNPNNISRHDPLLVLAVEKLGPFDSAKQRADNALGSFHRRKKLAIVTIPDGVEWVIEEYDGAEWVAECHRTWYPKR